MLTISNKERQKINHQLKLLGFAGLEDPAIFQQIATLYQTHESFRGLLMSTAPNQRRIAYEALRPHLSFTAKPLDVYEREIKDKAEREQWDTWNGTAYPDKFKVQNIETEEGRLARLAEEAIEAQEHERNKGVLEMVCTRCTIVQYFPAAKRKEAVKKAHEAGWRWEERNGIKRQYCPDHVPGRATMTIECSECEKKERIRVWDEQDGYAKARLMGWEIDIACKCPRCTSKLVVVQ
jgi:hypothetical protein